MTTSTIEALTKMTFRELAALPSRLWDHFQDKHLLSNLTDDQLNDTGLSKRDIERECQKSFWSKSETMGFTGKVTGNPDSILGKNIGLVTTVSMPRSVV